MKEPFQNTAVAFDYKSSQELKRAHFLFSIMQKFPRLSVLLARFGDKALRWKLPFARTIIRSTFYEHFCGGETREQCTPVINKLARYKVKTALDFGVEGQNTPKEWLRMANEIIETIVFASKQEAIPVVSLKLSAIASFELLEKYSNDPFSLLSSEQAEMVLLKERFEQICAAAQRASISIYLDAEESWIQPAIDELAIEMMTRFNKKKPVVFNTYQLYLKASLGRLKDHRALCIGHGALFAAKLVRGAYIDKENDRAASLGLESPVQPSKKATDLAYDTAVNYCLYHLHDTYFSLASHNEKSNKNVMGQLKEKDLPTDHVHFCQLYGMSDHITFNLAQKGYYAMKYVPFGKVEDTFPYMIRRAEENTSVTSEASAELARIREELRRRKQPAAHATRPQVEPANIIGL